MTAWTDALRGLARPDRDATRFGRGAPTRANDVGYAGPADGDFARYVDQLMAEAEAQRQAHMRRDARAPARAPSAPSRRDTGASARKPAARNAASPTPSAGLTAKDWSLRGRWPKLLPLAVWLLVLGVLFFAQGAAVSLVSIVIVGFLMFNRLRKLLSFGK